MNKEEIVKKIMDLLEKAGDDFGEIQIVIRRSEEDAGTEELESWKENAANHVAQILGQVLDKYLAEWLIKTIIADFTQKYVESLEDW